MYGAPGRLGATAPPARPGQRPACGVRAAETFAVGTPASAADCRLRAGIPRANIHAAVAPDVRSSDSAETTPATEDPLLNDDQLIAVAREARENAHATYSGFRVGAALLSAVGRVFTGVNVENASVGLSVCAERNAVAKAVSEGVREFSKIAIVTDSPDEPTMPCGVCRQVLWEFAHDLRILVESDTGRRVVTSIAELFPRPFTTYKD